MMTDKIDTDALLEQGIAGPKRLAAHFFQSLRILQPLLCEYKGLCRLRLFPFVLKRFFSASTGIKILIVSLCHIKELMAVLTDSSKAVNQLLHFRNLGGILMVHLRKLRI